MKREVLFKDIPKFDGSDPIIFDDWTDKLETVCSISGQDIWVEAICYSSGPVRKILLTIQDDTIWEDIKAELRRNFSNKKTRMHATVSLSNFRHQKVGENLRNYIDSYFWIPQGKTHQGSLIWKRKWIS